MSPGKKKKDMSGSVLVVGGGVGGIQASLDLAESGYFVYLLENSPAIGGVMAQLDKTFPTNDCSMCILAPKLVECGRHHNIQILSYSDIVDVKGKLGKFKVKIKKKPRGVDTEKCTGCGVCMERCPVKKIPDEFNAGIGFRSAINIPFPQAVPNWPVIDQEHCIYYKKKKCGLCQKECAAGAVIFDTEPEFVEIEVGSIILSPGFEVFEAKLKKEYGYGRFPNVITSIQLERILNVSGPYQGEVIRPSDNTHPINVAFIQCVGSRDVKIGNEYCSSVCCTYAIKEAIIAKEHFAEIKPTIFYMDMRTYGKGFEEFYNRAKDEYQVRFIRAGIACVEEVPETKDLRISYETEEGKLIEEDFNMVVLSVGLTPPNSAEEFAEKFGIVLDKYGFSETSLFSPVTTSKPGIFVCGAFQGPKDIPETVIQASGAASCAGSALSPARGTQVVEKEFPSEIDVSQQEPRIGAFICHCGINIGGYVDVPQVFEYVKTLPGVVYAEENLYTCSQDTQEKIKEVIKEHDLNRIVVASCTPRTHGPLFQQTIREGGLNKYLFEMANIRDQCSWVHMHERDAATEKAKDLVRMAVAKARLIEPLSQQSLGVTQRAMVIGGGISGMAASLSLADQGFEVFLVEKEDKLGGMANKIYYTLEGGDVQEKLKETVKQVSQADKIKVYLNTSIKDIKGFIGNFKTTVQSGPGESQTEELEHGIVVVAAGAQELKSEEYLYGKDERVVTQLELEKMLATPKSSVSKLNSVVMIQCVGSRYDERPYCSRICCSQAIKNALKIKETNPKANIYILYRDIRTYGFKEEYYQKAREAGIIFIRYDLENKPKIVKSDPKEGRIRLKVFDPIVQKVLLIDTDLLALSVAIVAGANNEELSQLLKVPLNEDKFFLEAHVKLRPVEFATEGVFLCGLAHSPKSIDESISQAYAAASRATTILSKEYIEIEGIVATIDREICSGCKLCIEVCPYGAISYIEAEDVAEVNEALCKGCGNCAATCPSKACLVKNFKDEQIYAQIEALL